MALRRRLRRQHLSRLEPSDPIKHVIVLMLENRSFDQMLGCYKEVYPELEGVNPKDLYFNTDKYGKVFRQQQSNDPIVDPDPRHDLEHVAVQLRGGNSGFIRSYESAYPKTDDRQRQRIMDYFGKNDLPALHALADEFTICDHWYSSVPGPTWTNRFFVHSGTSIGRVEMPEHALSNPLLYYGYHQDTIYDRLSERNVSWRVYYSDVAQSLVLVHQQRSSSAEHYRLISEFEIDVAGPEDEFPAYTFIEPKYFHVPFTDPQNDDHPPHSTMEAQRLIGNVYNAIRANEPLWLSSLFIVVYDEHGGFYDHVPPPTAVPPDGFSDEWSFDRLGVRVPALLISPWVEKQYISTQFEHCSILRYLSDKWRLGSLTSRVDVSNSIATAFPRFTAPRLDTPETVPLPPMAMAAGPLIAGEGQPVEPMNENQKALSEFSKYLEEKAAAESGTFKMSMPPGAETEAEAVKRRTENFLAAKTSGK